MLKLGLAGLIVCVGLSASAGELKNDMNQLAGSVSALQMGFFTNNKSMTLDTVKTLRAQVKKYFATEESVKKLLPENLQYKSSIAINSAEMIEKYTKEIEDLLKDKNIRMIERQMKTQKAFLEIQNQCFRCHNLVRDWE